MKYYTKSRFSKKVNKENDQTKQVKQETLKLVEARY